MNIHIQDLVRENAAQTIQTQLNVDWLTQVRSDVLSAEPLNVNLRLSGDGELITLDGTLQGDVTLSCSRCLDPVIEHINVDLHERLQPARKSAGTTTQGVDAPPSDDEILQIEEDELDLEPLIEETVVLALPFFPLCKEDCAGLCPTCGVNRNHETCDCVQDTIDPRLAVLQEWLQDQKD